MFRLRVDLTPAWCAKWLGGFAFVLVALHLWIHVLHYRFIEVPWTVRSFLDLDEEQSLGTWFSAGLLICASLAAFSCARSERVAGGGQRRPWKLLGVGFLLLSMDEVVGFHETVNTLTEFSWTIPAAVLVLLVGAAYVPFLARLPRRTALLFLVAGVVDLGGAVGVERASEGLVAQKGTTNLAYSLTTALEEGMEMVGAILFLFAALGYGARRYGARDARDDETHRGLLRRL